VGVVTTGVALSVGDENVPVVVMAKVIVGVIVGRVSGANERKIKPTQ